MNHSKGAENIDFAYLRTDIQYSIDGLNVKIKLDFKGKMLVFKRLIISKSY